MCTAIEFLNKSLYFGRNMDIEYDFGQKIVIMPDEFPLATKCSGTLLKHYAVIGIARVEEGYPLYAEACNEKGLCMAGLNFPFNAVYADKESEGKIMLAPYELIPYVLGKCADICEARELISRSEIINRSYKPSLPVAPLHWMVSDKNGSFVVERTSRGLEIFDNPCGVMTNNPPFDSQIKNLEKIKGLSVKNPAGYFGKAEPEENYCAGVGALGLPGDYSSSSRFVKAVFLKDNSVCGESAESCVSQVLHILDAVAMPRGSVVTDEGKLDVTTYSCCIDAERGVYYYKTYDGFAVKKSEMTEELKRGSLLAVSEM